MLASMAERKQPRMPLACKGNDYLANNQILEQEILRSGVMHRARTQFERTGGSRVRPDNNAQSSLNQGASLFF
jgi:hypothetical protein